MESTTMQGVRLGTVKLDRVRMRENPRKRLDPMEIEELARSMEDTSGAMQFPLGYEVTDPEVDVELIAGERRWRAACLLRDEGKGPGTMTVRLVDEPSERDFLKWSLAENLFRVDLRPSEVGGWLARMLDMDDPESGNPLWSYRTLADEIGKDPRYISTAVQATRAPERVRAALDEGRCSMETASLIGSLPEAVQERAASEVLFGDIRMDAASARRHIAENFRRDLRTADFDREDADLLNDVGSCSGCEWWGGNREDVAGKAAIHVCLNPGCFRRKQAAHAEAVRMAETGAAEGEGVVVPPQLLDESEAEVVFEPHSRLVAADSGYVDLRDKPSPMYLVDGARNMESVPTWRQILKENMPPVVTALDGSDKPRDLVEVGPALRSAIGGVYGSLFKQSSGSQFLSKDEKAMERRIRAAGERESRQVLLEGVREFYGEMISADLSERVVSAALEVAIEQGLKSDDLRFLVEVLETSAKPSEVTPRTLLELIDSRNMGGDEMMGLLLLVLQVRMVRYHGFDAWCEEGPMESLCVALDFDAPGWRKSWKRRTAAAERDARAEVEREMEREMEGGAE